MAPHKPQEVVILYICLLVLWLKHVGKQIDPKVKSYW